MIISNLNVLLAQRGLKISDVARDTGLSRTTLYSMADNISGGYQLSTLDKLCTYLNVTPGDLFIYKNLDVNLIDFKLFEITENGNRGSFYFRINSDYDIKHYQFSLECNKYIYNKTSRLSIEIQDQEESLSLCKFLHSLGVEMHLYITDCLFDELRDLIKNEYMNRGLESPDWLFTNVEFRFPESVRKPTR